MAFLSLKDFLSIWYFKLIGLIGPRAVSERVNLLVWSILINLLVCSFLLDLPNAPNFFLSHWSISMLLACSFLLGLFWCPGVFLSPWSIETHGVFLFLDLLILQMFSNNIDLLVLLLCFYLCDLLIWCLPFSLICIDAHDGIYYPLSGVGKVT